MKLIKSRFFQFSRLVLLSGIICVGNIGCEADNSDSGGGSSGGGGGGGGGRHPDSVSGTWAGDGISVRLVEESRQSDAFTGGIRSEGSATLTNPSGTFGFGVYVYQSGGIYAQGDGFGVSGSVNGNTWNATYIFPDSSIYTLVVLKKQ